MRDAYREFLDRGSDATCKPLVAGGIESLSGPNNKLKASRSKTSVFAVSDVTSGNVSGAAT